MASKGRSRAKKARYPLKNPCGPSCHASSHVMREQLPILGRCSRKDLARKDAVTFGPPPHTLVYMHAGSRERACNSLKEHLTDDILTTCGDGVFAPTLPHAYLNTTRWRRKNPAYSGMHVHCAHERQHAGMYLQTSLHNLGWHADSRGSNVAQCARQKLSRKGTLPI